MTQAHSQDFGLPDKSKLLTGDTFHWEHVQDNYLICLNFCNQIFKGRQTTQPHDSFRLLHSQTLDFGGGASTQHNLLPSEEVLELCVIGGLPAKGGTGQAGYLYTETEITVVIQRSGKGEGTLTG